MIIIYSYTAKAEKNNTTRRRTWRTCQASSWRTWAGGRASEGTKEEAAAAEAEAQPSCSSSSSSNERIVASLPHIRERGLLAVWLCLGGKGGRGRLVCPMDLNCYSRRFPEKACKKIEHECFTFTFIMHGKNVQALSKLQSILKWVPKHLWIYYLSSNFIECPTKNYHQYSEDYR